MIWPFIGIPVGVMIITLQWPTTWPWLIIIPIAIVWAGLWGYFVEKRRVAPEKTFIIIALLGMVWGFIWTYWVSGVLIDLLTFVGVITKLSSTYLALTIIAIGNALPDALITISFAKQGKAIMGITGGYAGQLFGLLIGFGLAMLKMTLKNGGPIPLDLFTNSDNILDVIVIFVALITLVLTIVIGLAKKLKFDSTLGWTILIIYIAFFIGATVVACLQAYT